MKHFTEQELNELYWNKIHLPDSYFQQYEHVPPCPLRSWDYSWKNNDFPRVWCTLDFRSWIHKYGLSSPAVLGYTCETDPELEFLQPSEKILVDYPTHDLHTIGTSFPHTFDFFLFNQTLEHLYNPYLAMKNIYDCMKPGGVVFTSVPTINIPHMTPIHFGGFTPMGLATLCMSAGFEVLELGQWGNLEYIQRLWSTHQWPGYTTLQKNNRVTNERDNCCQCWILVRKPIQSP
jgi:SAM-dependent methyltransferase